MKKILQISLAFVTLPILLVALLVLEVYKLCGIIEIIEEEKYKSCL